MDEQNRTQIPGFDEPVNIVASFGPPVLIGSETPLTACLRELTEKVEQLGAQLTTLSGTVIALSAEMRKMKEQQDASWKSLEEAARANQSTPRPT